MTRLDELEIAQKLAPNNAAISALFARAYSQLDDRDQTLQYVQLAEQQAQQDPPVVSTSRQQRQQPGQQRGQRAHRRAEIDIERHLPVDR